MRVFSGMQPSGEAHLGNYFGSMKPNIDLVSSSAADENLYCVVDLHALTSVQKPDELRRFRIDLAKDLLACGFDTQKGILFFQSDVPEHTELLWYLSCVSPMGLLERAVSYKDKIEKGLDASVGLFAYPVLQAADILLYNADTVPVGKDQKQHIEIARDIGGKFNHRYGDVFVLPEPVIRDDVAVVPGTDGEKMSKSYGNTLPLFADEKVIKKAIMSIVTDSKDVDEPKDPGTCIPYQLHALLLDGEGQRELADVYRAGGLGYGDAKKKLLEAYLDFFASMRAVREKISDSDALDVMGQGAKRARMIAVDTMERVRTAVGVRG